MQSTARLADHMKGILGTVVATVGLAIAAGPAQAGLVQSIPNPADPRNHVNNGGFETGDFTGWTQTGNTAFNGVDGNPDTGNFAAFFGPVGSIGGISQGVGGLQVGATYHVDFAFGPDGGVPSSFSASFGGGPPLVSLSNPGASGYQHFDFAVTATAASETLAFNFQDDPGFLFFDSVSVIPEPASLALLGSGLVGLYFGRRRKAAN